MYITVYAFPSEADHWIYSITIVVKLFSLSISFSERLSVDKSRRYVPLQHHCWVTDALEVEKSGSLLVYKKRKNSVFHLLKSLVNTAESETLSFVLAQCVVKRQKNTGAGGRRVIGILSGWLHYSFTRKSVYKHKSLDNGPRLCKGWAILTNKQQDQCFESSGLLSSPADLSSYTRNYEQRSKTSFGPISLWDLSQQHIIGLL